METSLKPGFAQIFVLLPNKCEKKKSQLPKIWGAAAPLAARPVHLCILENLVIK